VRSWRGRERGATRLPCRRTSNQTTSSACISAGSSAVKIGNQRTTAGTESSSSMPASRSTAATPLADILIGASRATSLVLIGAPGVCCSPSMMRTPRRTRSVTARLQPWRAPWSPAASHSAALSSGSWGGGKPRRRPDSMSAGTSSRTNWRCVTGRIEAWRSGALDACEWAPPLAGRNQPAKKSWRPSAVVRLMSELCCTWQSRQRPSRPTASVLAQPPQLSTSRWRRHHSHARQMRALPRCTPQARQSRHGAGRRGARGWQSSQSPAVQ